MRSTREGPLSHITTWVPGDFATQFGKRELAKKPILMLLEESGVRVGGARQTISARLADAQVASHLGIAVGSAFAIYIVRELVTAHGGTIDVTSSHADGTTFTVHLPRAA